VLQDVSVSFSRGSGGCGCCRGDRTAKRLCSHVITTDSTGFNVFDAHDFSTANLSNLISSGVVVPHTNDISIFSDCTNACLLLIENAISKECEKRQTRTLDSSIGFNPLPDTLKGGKGGGCLLPPAGPSFTLGKSPPVRLCSEPLSNLPLPPLLACLRELPLGPGSVGSAKPSFNFDTHFDGFRFLGLLASVNSNPGSLFSEL